MAAARRQKKIPLRGAATVAALQQLSSAGKAGSFEELAARLLAKLVGQPIRRARSGSQEGKDALSHDSALAIECKRYLESTSLPARQLISELEEVKSRHPDLQLWILATTTVLGATEKEKLDHAAHRKGLAVLYLDLAAAGHLLEETHSIAALCATAPDTSLGFFSEVVGKGDIRKIRSELEAIRSDPEFEPWVEWLKGEVRNRLPIWRFVTERHNLALRERIRETAFTVFGTRYHAGEAVPREARAQLDDWFHSALAKEGPDIPPVAVVVGERYDGKTWLVYQWLVEIARSSPVPIFFVGSARGMQSHRALTELQIEDLAPSLKRERSYAESFVHNFRSQDVGKTPWALIVLDGLNEYAPNHDAWLRHLETAVGRGEISCRPAAVLVTVRARSWPELKDLLPHQDVPTEIVDHSRRTLIPTLKVPLGPFTEKELQEALIRLSLPADLLESLPPEARALAHRPRYLGLLAEHLEKLGDYAAITPDVLHWLDLCDKVGHMRLGRMDWTPAQYQNFLRDLAKRWLDQKFLDETSVRELLGDATMQVPTVLADLRSEGVLSGENGNYIVQPDRLAIGYGLFLRDSLLRSFRQGGLLAEILHDLLAPFAGDEAVHALRAASTLMLVEIAAAKAASTDAPRESVEVLSVLLWEWLDSRNLGQEDLGAIHELRRLLFDFLISSWREIWNRRQRDSRVREIAVMVFGEEVESGGATSHRLRSAVQEWFRLVPLEGSWYQKEMTRIKLSAEEDNSAATKDAVASLIRSRIGEAGLGELGLQAVDSLDILSLQSLGLYLVSRSPLLVDPGDLLAFMAVRVILEEPIDSGDFWVIRRAAEEAPLEWFEHKSPQCGQGPETILHRALRELVRITNRADLEEMRERLSQTAEVERHQARPWPTRTNYRRLFPRAVKSPSEARWFAERARELFCDPSLLPPPREQRLAFAQALRENLLERSRSPKVGDLQDFENFLPAIAAWAPDLGAELIEAFLRTLPARVQSGEPTLLMELRGHTTLVRGRARRALQDALRLSRQRNKGWTIAQRELTLSLLPAATLDETVTLLTAKEEEHEHKEVLRLAGALRSPAERRSLVGPLKAARSPLRKRRLRFLLAMAGGYPLPAPEIAAICRTLSQGEDRDIAAALQLAAESEITGIDPSLLFPIASGESANKTFAPDYASHLLLENHDHAEIKDYLDDYWRAKSAARRPEDAQAFLNEISSSLLEYRERRGGLDHRWEQYDLPLQMLTYVDQERVAEWTRAFVSWDGTGWRFWGGLIRPAFGWCLRHAASEQAGALWSQVFPFQRRRFGGGSRLTIDGVDWVLHELNHPESDDNLARSFLNHLILDARNDLELFEVALGAYFQGGDRLQGVAQDLSAAPQAERRVRAVAILGWLAKGRERLEALWTSDPSLWVREQAEIALKRHETDSWSRIWLERFLTAEAVPDRWAAGQLFLACADRRFNAWAWERVREGRLQRRLKGEAFLLLKAAQDRAKKESDKLQANFLGYTVRELSTVAYPWRRDDEWILDRYGRRN